VTAAQGWDWQVAWGHLPELLEGLAVTVRITVLAMALALSLGLVLAVARHTSPRPLRAPVVAFVQVVRGTPLLVQLFVLYYVAPDLGLVLSPMTAAVVGLGVHYATYTSETYRAGIGSVPAGQVEAAVAVGLGPWARWRHVILPQALRSVVPALANHVVASLKDAPLAATITVVGVLGAAQRIQARTFRGLEAFTLAGVLFLAVSVPASWLARRIEHRSAAWR
jgi:polar amino acid transport system permease protein